MMEWLWKKEVSGAGKSFAQWLMDNGVKVVNVTTISTGNLFVARAATAEDMKAFMIVEGVAYVQKLSAYYYAIGEGGNGVYLKL